MSLYLEVRVESTADSSGTLDAKWSYTSSRPLLAMLRSQGEVTIVDEEGVAVSNQPSDTQQDLEALVIQWNPVQKVLAIGSSSGTVYFWSEFDHYIDPIKRNGVAITLLLWSQSGDRLFVADQNGSISSYTLCLDEHDLFMTSSIVAAISSGVCIYMGDGPGSSCFMVGCATGGIYLGDESGTFSEVGNVGSAINAIFYANTSQIVIAVSVHAVMFVYKIGIDKLASLQKKVQLCIKGDGSDLLCAWDGNNMLIAANKEPCVRIWSVNTEENVSLSLLDPRHMAKGNDIVISVAYNDNTQILVGGTSFGRIVMWRWSGTADKLSISEENWMCLPPMNSCWDSGIYLLSCKSGLIAAVSSNGVSVLTETVLNCARAFNTIASQIAADKLIVQMSNGTVRKLTANIRIRGLCIGENLIIVWNGQKIEVFEIIDNDSLKFASAFNCQTNCCTIQGQTMFVIGDYRVNACNLQGIVKKTLSYSSDEGRPVLIDVAGNYLVAVSNQGTIKIWETNRREARAVVPGRRTPPDFGLISHCKINAIGSHVAMLFEAKPFDGNIVVDHSQDTQVLIYDIELDRFETYDFAAKDAFPTSIFWDEFEPILLLVVVRPLVSSQLSLSKNTKEGEGETKERHTFVSSASIFTFFVTSEHGIHFQDQFDIGGDILISSDTPFTYYLKAQTGASGAGTIPHIDKRVMRDFLGLEYVDDATKRNLCKFSFKMAIGDMDEAYQAVRNIENASIWNNMAKMCVITRRLDMAHICLGNMGFATGAASLRESRKHREPEAQLACMAIELGMIDEAITLYKDCRRYDLLVELYQAAGNWDEAISICETHHRILLKPLKYSQAKFFEGRGQFNKAIAAYEACNSHWTEVPRMLLKSGRIGELEKYVEKKNNFKVKLWMAQYNEGRGFLDAALELYLSAPDYVSCVRIYCIQGNMEKARELCKNSGNLAACCHLAHVLELNGEYEEAIGFFAQAKRFNHALRLAKEQSKAKEVYMMALESPPALQLEAAEYLEEQQIFDKAIILNHKGGNLSKALELCFKADQYESLSMLISDMGSDTSPTLIEKCASFFIDNKQYDKAAQLYITARRFAEALETCVQNRLPISDSMAESLTPPKSKDDRGGSGSRSDHLNNLAKYLAETGSFHMATKKFTQAGDKLRAMKCLLKSNDTSKIIYYATMTKKKEVYILAANYLQNVDWHADPDIIKAIITFYSKAEAYESLALFYDSCAQREIDDFRDYEKALLAIKESLKILVSNNAQPSSIQQIQRRVQLIEEFVQARTLLIQGNVPAAMQICIYLTEQEDTENAIREGDVYALMIEYRHENGDLDEAGTLLARMKQQGLDPRPFIKSSILKDLDGGRNGDDIEDDIEDNIQE